MRHFVWILCGWLAACGAAPTEVDGSPQTSAQAIRQDLREDLLKRVAEDQALRKEWADVGLMNASKDLLERVRICDEANTAALKQIVAEHGWPTVQLIGRDGVEAAFLIVQHADRDPEFQQQMLPLLIEAHQRGEVQGGDVALLTDRVLTGMGKPQKYGTQIEIVGGEFVVKPVEDSEQLDQLRAQMGLPPMEAYLQLIRKAYGSQQ